MNSSAPQILFITSSRIGDAVLSSGLLSYIESSHPSARVTIACAPLVTSLFEGYPLLQRIIPLKKQSYNRHWITLWREVIGTKWDIIIDLRDSAVSRLVRAEQRYIFSKQIDKSQHKIEQNAQLLSLTRPPASTLWPSAEQQKTAKALIPENNDVVIGVGPTANWIGKTWPAENFIEILNWLIEELENGNLLITPSRHPCEGRDPHTNTTIDSGLRRNDEKIQEPSQAERPNGKDKTRGESGGTPVREYKIAVFGAPGEEEDAYKVYNAMPEDRRLDIIAKGNPGTAAAAIARCDFYIGNDSGLMHCAAAAKIPTVGLFGPSYPHIYAPWGPHTTYAQTPESFDELIDFKGYHPDTTGCLMETLTTDMVKDTITKFLKKCSLK